MQKTQSNTTREPADFSANIAVKLGDEFHHDNGGYGRGDEACL